MLLFHFPSFCLHSFGFLDNNNNNQKQKVNKRRDFVYLSVSPSLCVLTPLALLEMFLAYNYFHNFWKVRLGKRKVASVLMTT